MVPSIDFNIAESFSVPPGIEVIIPPDKRVDKAIQVHQRDSCNHATHSEVSLPKEVAGGHVDNDDSQRSEDGEDDRICLVDARRLALGRSCVVHCGEEVLSCRFGRWRVRVGGLAA